MGRLHGRIIVFARALPKLVFKALRRKPAQPARILIAHQLLLGDALLLTALIAKTRRQYPCAQIVLACPKGIAPLYAGRPFGVTALAFDPRDGASVQRITESGPYDLGIVAGDNRYSWLALAAGCRWIVAHGGDRPAWKNWPVDERIAYPDAPAAWTELAAGLVGGAAPRPYRLADWPAPPASTPLPAGLRERRYIVLHPGASSAVKRWPAQRWRELAQRVEAQGYTIVWSGGQGEAALVAEVAPGSAHLNLAGRLDLVEMWHLLAGAHAVVCPDTGIAHLARLVGVPAVALFGPGNPAIHGAGRYWQDAPFVALGVANLPCRDQSTLFRRRVSWVRRCSRSAATCVAWRNGHADCMTAHSVDAVYRALQSAMALARAR
ncbi:glycosyltransferase family 9 protein [Paraburkholderia silviterrae]|uniref:Glycosyltransferase family 9 protein n=1 Tax=Paraburkholderia silviterrae TaxID=2528715 RepID=A0A4R5M972_9BURK|nr:glycosyltransferase family 9 protein [Paraburkholderia silviterrae]TDG23123.1 glycosyltransferase family 9 protein [Paraburkholderia silviterrae]